ncbi:MAG: hypothetical protein M1820_008039 [Bogoriella megaspora]|nr:MAG: hypothetical protein M1820_008039 [Bogoriella megaspora]
MFGPFRSTSPLSGGLLWKTPWRLSAPRKARHRQRLRHVDKVVATLDTALSKLQPRLAPAALTNKKLVREFKANLQAQKASSSSGPEGEVADGGEEDGLGEDEAEKYVRQMGQTTKLLERWKAEMPTEAEMLPRDKYTMFDRKEKKYRKGVHSEFLPSLSFSCLGLSGWGKKG